MSDLSFGSLAPGGRYDCIAFPPRRARRRNGYRIGEFHQKAILSDDDVRTMRDIYESGAAGYRTLSRLFDCGESTARDICTYRTRVDA